MIKPGISAITATASMSGVKINPIIISKGHITNILVIVLYSSIQSSNMADKQKTPELMAIHANRMGTSTTKPKTAIILYPILLHRP